MSVITLTDRISVSVRAKNNTEKSAQNKATGANIQRALGGSDLSDSDLEEIGNVNSIQDEQGNEWIKMEDIIAAGRKMKEKGAFKERHLGLKDSDGTLHTLNYVYSWNGIDVAKPNYPSSHKIIEDRNNINPSNVYAAFMNNGVPILFSKESNRASDFWWTGWGSGNSYGSASYIGKSINGVSYSAFCFTCNGTDINESILNDQGYFLNKPSNYDKAILGYLFGPVSSDSLIDWDAPNAEVERQIKNLHDTWDVSDHPGAVTGNGTYVLAGPIEFNDGD